MRLPLFTMSGKIPVDQSTSSIVHNHDIARAYVPVKDLCLEERIAMAYTRNKWLDESTILGTYIATRLRPPAIVSEWMGMKLDRARHPAEPIDYGYILSCFSRKTPCPQKPNWR